MIEVLATGPVNTVQDLGRPGHRRLGVGSSGAMDPVALRVANILLGNAEDAAALEIQVFPFTIRFATAGAFAVTGADASPRLDGRTLPPWWAAQARAGQVLQLGAPADRARCYLAVAGGIDVPMVLGSRSTHLRGGFGGLAGRTLRAGDVLAALPSAAAAVELGAVPPVRPSGRVLAIRAIPAAEHDRFPAAAQDAFWAAEWRITAQSNRHGYRLIGPALGGGDAFDLRSTGIVPGVIQVPPNGAPIVQMSDANTAGGYPKMAGVIGADLPVLGQARLGSSIRFVKTTYAEGVAAERPIADYLARMRRLVALHRQSLAIAG